MTNRKPITIRRGARRPMTDALLDELRARVREGGAMLRGGRNASLRYEVAAPARSRRRPPRGKGDPVAAAPDVGNLRARFQLSQAKFAALLGISAGTLRNWEQGRRTPEGPARVLLQVAACHPEAVLSAVARTGYVGARARSRSR
jgi:putative transcriptional regulator